MIAIIITKIRGITNSILFPVINIVKIKIIKLTNSLKTLQSLLNNFVTVKAVENDTT